MDDKVKLDSYLNMIDNKTLILPDFQRDYVWVKEEDKVDEFVTSVLSQLPIGSIITFKDDFKSFANKEIGFNKTIKFPDNFQEKVNFLLDGQQRITTLSIVFSDRIFKKIKTDNTNYKPDMLLQKDKIKKRYFLTLPRFNDPIGDDFFGYNSLYFPFDKPDMISFCSYEIKNLIQSLPFTYTTNDRNRDAWYYPNAKDLNSDYEYLYKVVEGAVDGIDFNNDGSKCGVIPLYLLTDYSWVIKSILDKMVDRRLEYFRDYLFPKTKIDALKDYIDRHQNIYNIDLSQGDEDIFNAFNMKLGIHAKRWAENMNKYLDSCIEQLRLNVIAVSDENTSRAINMYEALNKGGAKLTTYDLIIARAACEDEYGKAGYAERNKKLITSHCNKKLLTLLGNRVTTWNSKDNMQTINKNGDIAPILINQFLNLLCCIVNLEDDDKLKQTLENLSPDYCKAKKQLEMTSKEIVSKSEIALKSVIDALMILQFKCGVFNISQIDYNLILLPIAYGMYIANKCQFNDVDLNKTVEKLVCIYWYCLFTGEYQSDQSSVVMKHIEWVHNWVYSNIKPDDLTPAKIEESLGRVLAVDRYNDLNTLTYQNSFTPKKAVKDSIIQYVLSKEPVDFIKNEKYVHINAWDVEEFEIHHMIPLAAAVDIKTSTKMIRDSDSIINSPLNMALISKEANRIISNKQITEYKNYLSDGFESYYHFSADIKDFRYQFNDETSETKLKYLLKVRHESITSDVKRDIRDLAGRN